jgi:hypothetical protein
MSTGVGEVQDGKDRHRATRQGHRARITEKDQQRSAGYIGDAGQPAVVDSDCLARLHWCSRRPGQDGPVDKGSDNRADGDNDHMSDPFTAKVESPGFQQDEAAGAAEKCAESARPRDARVPPAASIPWRVSPPVPPLLPQAFMRSRPSIIRLGSISKDSWSAGSTGARSFRTTGGFHGGSPCRRAPPVLAIRIASRQACRRHAAAGRFPVTLVRATRSRSS